MKKHLAAFLLALAAGTASASTYTTDYTDLWYVPSESGWGLNLIHQEDIIFGTLFVYGPDNTPHWYVASDMRYQGSGGPITYTGVLYETSGTWFPLPGFQMFGVPRPVGTITFSTDEVTRANLVYVVDGRRVEKRIERQTWRNQDFGGNFRGGVVGTYSGCTGGNGAFEGPATYQITQTGAQVRMIESGSNFTCTYNGTYTPGGTAGTISGTINCTDSAIQQSFTMSEARVGLDFFASGLSINVSGSCRFSGRIGGVRR